MISQHCVGSGDGLVPPGNKSLPEPILTEIYVAIWELLGPHELAHIQ